MFGLGKFTLKIPNLPIFFPLGQKNCFGLGQKVPDGSDSYLLQVKSKLRSSQVRSGPISKTNVVFFLPTPINVHGGLKYGPQTLKAS